ARLNRHLAAWSGQAPARPQFAAAPARTRREILLVNKPGAVQASYRIGQTIVPATNPDWPALAVAQQILGGSSTAWLFSNLREKKGYTYGAYASSTRQLDPGAWFMYGDVRNAVADSALDLFLEYANRLKTQPVSASDLEIAKARLSGGFPLTIETPSQIASQIASALLLGQGKEHVLTWRQQIDAVTAADIQRAATRYLQPENSLVVISGDASVLQPKLAKYGNVTVVDEEGKPMASAAADAAEPQQKLTIDASNLQPMTLTYGVTAQGMEVAEVVRTITRETVNGKNVVKSSASTTGMMTGKQDLTFEAKTFAPVSSSMSQQAGGREFSAILNVTNGKVSGMASMPPNGDPAPIDAALPEGAILPGMDEFVIWLTDFSVSKELKLNVFSPQSGSVIPVTLKVTGESKQKVAAGEFDVYDLEMQTSQGSMKAYVRKAAPHIVVKQEFVAQPVVIELKTLK
ncbi:MAG TPA: insulinase family protein, partial [Longimicrobiales bacterium]